MTTKSIDKRDSWYSLETFCKIVKNVIVVNHFLIWNQNAMTCSSYCFQNSVAHPL